MKPVLQVENLTKRYNGFTAVDRVSFEIGQGEIVGMIGPNGAGKTTTIQMLLSLLEPTEGKITIFGKDFSQNHEELLSQMNFVAPYALLPYNLTVYENLLIFSLLYGVKNYKKKVAEIIQKFDLTTRKKQRAGSLSSGEQMRLGTAKAFLSNPRLLLLDEPTTSLDPLTARQLRETIYREVKNSGGSILWTSHNMQEIETMCDRVIFLLKGRIVASDKPANLKKQFGKESLEEVFISLAKENNLPRL